MTRVVPRLAIAFVVLLGLAIGSGTVLAGGDEKTEVEKIEICHEGTVLEVSQEAFDRAHKQHTASYKRPDSDTVVTKNDFEILNEYNRELCHNIASE